MDQSAANDDREDAVQHQISTVATDDDHNGDSAVGGDELTLKKQQDQELEQQRVEALKATREALYQRCQEKLQKLDEVRSQQDDYQSVTACGSIYRCTECGVRLNINRLATCISIFNL